MGEMIASEEQIVKNLRSLIALDFDAIEAYQAAIARLQSALDRDQLRSFLADHRRHVFELSPLVAELHGQPVTEADFRRLLTKGRVVLGGVIGDRGVLEAMMSNEVGTTRSYQKASLEPGMPPRVRAVIERNLSDERRHLAWIQERLGTMTLASQRH
jgi:rubrerythrin